MKYVIYKDYQSGKHHIGYEYITVDVKTPFELFEIADAMWGKEQEKLYLMRIMQKIGKATPAPDGEGWKQQTYIAIMCKRSNEVGWHANDAEHSETTHIAKRHYKKDLEYINAVYHI